MYHKVVEKLSNFGKIGKIYFDKKVVGETMVGRQPQVEVLRPQGQQDRLPHGQGEAGEGAHR